MTSSGEVSEIDDDDVGLRWFVEYICYGYFRDRSVRYAETNYPPNLTEKFLKTGRKTWVEEIKLQDEKRVDSG